MTRKKPIRPSLSSLPLSERQGGILRGLPNDADCELFGLNRWGRRLFGGDKVCAGWLCRRGLAKRRVFSEHTRGEGRHRWSEFRRTAAGDIWLVNH